MKITNQHLLDGEQQPDSFVERRLRERLKSVQQALERRDKLSQQARQQESPMRSFDANATPAADDKSSFCLGGYPCRQEACREVTRSSIGGGGIPCSALVALRPRWRDLGIGTECLMLLI